MKMTVIQNLNKHFVKKKVNDDHARQVTTNLS